MTSESTRSSAAHLPPAASGFTASESTQEKPQFGSFSFSIEEASEGPAVLNVLKVSLLWENLELVSTNGAFRTSTFAPPCKPSAGSKKKPLVLDRPERAETSGLAGRVLAHLVGPLRW